MATVYSLICFGGRTGKTVTFTTSGSVVNLTRHGLLDASAVSFSSTGSLPTGLTAGVIYYAKQGADVNKFTLWTTSALTTQQTFSSTGSGTHTVKGSYFLGLTSGQLARYGSPGTERIFDSMASWRTDRVANAGAFDDEILEIGEAWVDYVNPGIQLTMSCGSLLVTSRVDGVRSAAWHGGIVGAGYALASYNSGSCVTTGWLNQTLDGFSAKSDGLYINGIQAGSLGATIKNMIAFRTIAAGQNGIYVTAAPGTHVFNCIATGFASGISVAAYLTGIVVANNLFYNNTTGVDATSSSTVYGFFYNNISVGNTTNWKATPTGINAASNNAGLSSDSPWQTSGGSSISITTSDFVDYAGGDFRPALSSSPQVDTGLLFYGAPASDIIDAEVPNYNNGGAEVIDAGPVEFDHGYGPHPATTTVTFTGVNADSEIRVYLPDQTEVAGIELCAANQQLTWQVYAPGSPDNTVRIVIVNTAYKIKEFDYTSAVGPQNLPVQQELDKWYSNP